MEISDKSIIFITCWPEKMKPVNILCIKWGQKYSANYVNVLYSMVKRNLRRRFRFICLTDDSRDIRQEVEIKAIPLVGFPDFDQRKKWTLQHGWLKLTCFANPLHDLEGETLFLDLDIVIVGNLDDFFTVEGDFLVIREWDKSDGTGNTSVFKFTIGQHHDLLESLQRAPYGLKKVRNEQEYCTQFIAKQGKLSYWPPGWCQSFKRHCLPSFPSNFYRQAQLPKEAKVIVFHGKPNPHEAVLGKSGKWYRKVLPVSWIEEYWY